MRTFQLSRTKIEMDVVYALVYCGQIFSLYITDVTELPETFLEMGTIGKPCNHMRITCSFYISSGSNAGESKHGLRMQ